MASELWTDEHTSERMLSFHLNEAIDVSSRKAEFIDRSVEWIASRFNIGRDSAIADFGCGPGLYATRLAKRGANVTGIDFSGRSIAYAKEIAARDRLSINYVKQNYLDFETEDSFTLVLMIMCDFCALSPAQRRGILRKFHTLLKPGGSVLLDVYSLTAFEQKEEVATCEVNLLNGFWSPNKYYGFLNTFKYFDEKVALDKYTIVEAQRIIEEVYSDVAGTPYDRKSNEFAVIAKKAWQGTNYSMHPDGNSVALHCRR